MKTILGAAMALLSLAAHSVGDYDGIYQPTGSNSTFVSVHQSGGMLLTVTNEIGTSSGGLFSNKNGTVRASQLLTWDYMLGPIVGNVATIAGQTTFGACNESYSVTFGDGKATATLTAVSQTLLGASQGIKCGTGTPIGMQQTFSKVF